MKKHKSFEEEERMDLDEALAPASLDTVTRLDPFVSALHNEDVETVLEMERRGSLSQEGSHSSLPSSPLPLVSSIPLLQESNFLPASRAETDNASDFDLEAVLAGTKTIEEDEQREGSINSVIMHKSTQESFFSKEDQHGFPDDFQQQFQDPLVEGEPPQILRNEQDALTHQEQNEPSPTPTPSITRQQSLFSGAEHDDGLVRINLLSVNSMLEPLNHHPPTENLTPVDQLLPPVTSETAKAESFTQTDDLNRQLLFAAASNIPSHFFESSNKSEEEGEEYNEDDYQSSAALQEYIRKIQAGEEEGDEHDNTVVNEYIKPIQEEEDNLQDTPQRPLFIRQYTSQFDNLSGNETETKLAPISLARQYTSQSDVEPQQTFSVPKFGTDFEIGSTTPSVSPAKIETTSNTLHTDYDENFGDFEEATPSEPAINNKTQALSSNDDFGEFEEAETKSPPPDHARERSVPDKMKPSFFAQQAEGNFCQILNRPSCPKCGAPTNYDMFSVCVACWEPPQSSSEKKHNLSSRASSAIGSGSTESILNDLLLAIDFDSCLEDPSALPLAALAATDNEGALRLLLGDEAVDTRTVSGRSQPVNNNETLLQKAAISPKASNTVANVLQQSPPQTTVLKPNITEEENKSFFVV